jgi:hypothetical protein
MKRLKGMVRKSVILLAFVALKGSLSAQVYFPLHIGDAWSYTDWYSIECEGTSILFRITADTLLGGRRYLKFFDYSPYSGPYVRADSARVYEYDTTTQAEYVIFDFFAKPGDTVSVRDHGNKVTIALGSLRFSVGNTTYVLRDSIGMIRWYNSHSLCDLQLTIALINGKAITLGVPTGNLTLPISPSLEQNYPNPFNPSTTIRYALPIRAHVMLTVFNTLGQAVATLVNENEEGGYHDARFDGSRLVSGVYFYRLRAGDFMKTKCLVLVR